jgi:Photosynthesis system II assembly factor YCF48
VLSRLQFRRGPGRGGHEPNQATPRARRDRRAVGDLPRGVGRERRCAAGWTKIETPSNNKNDLAVVDARHVWTSDAFGVIERTTDGGVTWESQQVASQFSHFWGIDFADALNGWAVGDADQSNNTGMIYHTADGGATWTLQFEGVPGDLEILYDVAALTDQVAVAVGSLGLILRTTDGGQTWSEPSHPPVTLFSGIDFMKGRLCRRKRERRPADSKRRKHMEGRAPGPSFRLDPHGRLFRQCSGGLGGRVLRRGAQDHQRRPNLGRSGVRQRIGIERPGRRRHRYRRRLDLRLQQRQELRGADHERWKDLDRRAHPADVRASSISDVEFQTADDGWAAGFEGVYQRPG